MLTPNQTGRIDSPEGALDAPLARIYTGRGSDSALEPCSQHEREVGDRKGDDPALRPSRRQLELCHSVTARAVVSSLELSRFGQRGRRVSGDLFASVWRLQLGLRMIVERLTPNASSRYPHHHHRRLGVR